MEKNSRTKVSISLDAIAQNFEEMHRKLPKETKMMAVIKADGYGHGAVSYTHLFLWKASMNWYTR